MTLLKYLIIPLLISLTLSQSVPEKVQITNFPDQDQTIYQGWLSVNEQIQGFLYYQLFFAANPSDTASKDTPLILFLEGGPGDSSTQTVWADFAPYVINSNLNLTGPNNPDDVKFTFTKSNLSWADSYHLLSIDNPVLTGYSFSVTGISDNTTMQVGTNLVNFLGRFYQIFPELVGNPLYIVGHSYGGHWAPYFGYALARDNLTVGGNISVNLAGVIGMNPFTHLKVQKGYADLVFGAGYTDTKRRDTMLDYARVIDIYLKEDLLVNATNAFFDEFSYVLNLNGEIVTPNMTVDNVRRNHLLSDPDSIELTAHYLSPKFFFSTTSTNIQSARTVFNIPSNVQFLSGYVEDNFVNSGDFGIDFTYCIGYLLDHKINVTLLAAQDDGTVPATGVTELVGGINWSNKDNFQSSTRKPWHATNGTVVGNFKKYENLNYVILYKSGHVTTFDQPEVVLEFLHAITHNSWESL